MDARSESATTFISALQDAMERLRQLHGRFSRSGRRPHGPSLVLSGRPFFVRDGGDTKQFHGTVALGLLVTGSDGLEYDLAVDVLWDDARWTIQTEAWVESAAGGQDLLRQLPERTATDLAECIDHLAAAVDDLQGFEALVPGADQPA